MRKFLFLAGIVLSFMCFSCSCDLICSIAESSEEGNYPQSLTKLAVADFSSVQNSTVIDVNYTQGKNDSIELVCPEICKESIIIKVENGCLNIFYDPELSNESRNKLSKMLKHSKMYVSSQTISAVTINGSSAFGVAGDLNVEKFDAVLNGSGDILLQGMQCKGDVTLSVNGSGDIVLARELKAKSVKVDVNGSGDVRCEMITAYDVLATVDGSGDVVLANVTSINCRLGVNGSGDLRMKAIKVEDVDASLTGSGDVVMSGVCEKAVLTLIGSGDISAKDLVAQDVTASVTSSGDITCSAQQNLVARVTGSGNIGYIGSPKLTINAKKGSVYAL